MWAAVEAEFITLLEQSDVAEDSALIQGVKIAVDAVNRQRRARSNAVVAADCAIARCDRRRFDKNVPVEADKDRLSPVHCIGRSSGYSQAIVAECEVAANGGNRQPQTVNARVLAVGPIKRFAAVRSDLCQTVSASVAVERGGFGHLLEPTAAGRGLR